MGKVGKGKARGGSPADACGTLTESPKKSPMLWPEVSTEEYERMSPSDKKTVRVEAAVQNKALEEAATEGHGPGEMSPDPGPTPGQPRAP